MNVYRAVGVLAGVLLIGSVQAAPITYTLNLNATGRLGNTTFSNAPVTLTSVGADTDNIVTGGGLPTRNFATTAFSITGVGAGTLSGSTYWFVNTGQCAAGVGCAGVVLSGVSSIAYAFSSELLTYDLASAIGPVGNGSSWVYPQLALTTTAGTLILNTLPGFQFDIGPATFSARTAAVPEPASAALLGFTLTALAAMRRRVRR